MITINNIWSGFREIGADCRMFHIFPMIVWMDQAGVFSLQLGWFIWIIYIGGTPKDEN